MPKVLLDNRIFCEMLRIALARASVVAVGVPPDDHANSNRSHAFDDATIRPGMAARLADRLEHPAEDRCSLASALTCRPGELGANQAPHPSGAYHGMLSYSEHPADRVNISLSATEERVSERRAPCAAAHARMTRIHFQNCYVPAALQADNIELWKFAGSLAQASA